MELGSIIVKTVKALPIMIIGAFILVPLSAYIFQLEYRDAAVVAAVLLLSAFAIDRFLTALFAGLKPEEPPKEHNVILFSAALLMVLSSFIALIATLSIPMYWLLEFADPMQLAIRVALVGGLTATTSMIVGMFVALSRELTGLAASMVLELVYCFLGFPAKLNHSIERRLLYR